MDHMAERRAMSIVRWSMMHRKEYMAGRMDHSLSTWDKFLEVVDTTKVRMIRNSQVEEAM